jgi:putative FmdB family regulatory protein
MPLYVFKCVKCEEEIEVLQKYDDPAPQHCEQDMERVLAGGNISIELKGECWAKDGYTKKAKEPKESK